MFSSWLNISLGNHPATTVARAEHPNTPKASATVSEKKPIKFQSPKAMPQTMAVTIASMGTVTVRRAAENRTALRRCIAMDEARPMRILEDIS